MKEKCVNIRLKIPASWHRNIKSRAAFNGETLTEFLLAILSAFSDSNPKAKPTKQK